MSTAQGRSGAVTVLALPLGLPLAAAPGGGLQSNANIGPVYPGIPPAPPHPQSARVNWGAGRPTGEPALQVTPTESYGEPAFDSAPTTRVPVPAFDDTPTAPPGPEPAGLGGPLRGLVSRRSRAYVAWVGEDAHGLAVEALGCFGGGLQGWLPRARSRWATHEVVVLPGHLAFCGPPSRPDAAGAAGALASLPHRRRAGRCLARLRPPSKPACHSHRCDQHARDRADGRREGVGAYARERRPA